MSTVKELKKLLTRYKKKHCPKKKQDQLALPKKKRRKYCPKLSNLTLPELKKLAVKLKLIKPKKKKKPKKKQIQPVISAEVPEAKYLSPLVEPALQNIQRIADEEVKAKIKGRKERKETSRELVEDLLLAQSLGKVGLEELEQKAKLKNKELEQPIQQGMVRYSPDIPELEKDAILIAREKLNIPVNEYSKEEQKRYRRLLKEGKIEHRQRGVKPKNIIKTDDETIEKKANELEDDLDDIIEEEAAVIVAKKTGDEDIAVISDILQQDSIKSAIDDTKKQVSTIVKEEAFDYKNVHQSEALEKVSGKYVRDVLKLSKEEAAVIRKLASGIEHKDLSVKDKAITKQLKRRGILPPTKKGKPSQEYLDYLQATLDTLESDISRAEIPSTAEAEEEFIKVHTETKKILDKKTLQTVLKREKEIDQYNRQVDPCKLQVEKPPEPSIDEKLQTLKMSDDQKAEIRKLLEKKRKDNPTKTDSELLLEISKDISSKKIEGKPEEISKQHAKEQKIFDEEIKKKFETKLSNRPEEKRLERERQLEESKRKSDEIAYKKQTKEVGKIASRFKRQQEIKQIQEEKGLSRKAAQDLFKERRELAKVKQTPPIKESVIVPNPTDAQLSKAIDKTIMEIPKIPNPTDAQLSKVIDKTIMEIPKVPTEEKLNQLVNEEIIAPIAADIIKNEVVEVKPVPEGGSILDTVKQGISTVGDISDMAYRVTHGEKAYRERRNKERREKCKGARDLVEGEILVGCQNFAGPGTNLDAFLDYPVYNDIDRCAKIHDIEYTLAGMEEDPDISARMYRAADKAYNECTNAYSCEEDYLSAREGIHSLKNIPEDYLSEYLGRKIVGKYYGKE